MPTANPKILETQPIPLGDRQNQKHIMGKTQLDLTQFEFPPGSQISYAIRVTDNRNVQLNDGPMQTPNSSFAKEQVAQNDSQNAGNDESSASGESEMNSKSPFNEDAMASESGSLLAGDRSQENKLSPEGEKSPGREVSWWQRSLLKWRSGC